MFEHVAGLTLSVKSDSVRTASGRLDVLEKRAHAAGRASGGVSKGFGLASTRMMRFAVQAAAAYISVRTLATVLAKTIKVNMEFEQTMSSVEAVTRASDSMMVKMEASARKLGATTRWSASQAAEGMKFLGMAGFETNEIIAAMPGLLDLATAGALDLGRAADIASNIMSGFNLEASESVRVADVLAAISSSANTNVEQLGEGMKFVAPIAASLGIQIEQTAAAMGVLSDAGLQGSMAGTGLRRVMSELANPSAQATEVLENYGLVLEELDPASNNLIGIIEKLGAVGITAADAFTVFGDRGAPAILALTSQAARLRELNSEMDNSAGRASEMAKVMGDNLAGDLKILQSAMEELMLAGGERGLNGMLRSLTKRATFFGQAAAFGINNFDPVLYADKIAKLNVEIDKFGDAGFRAAKLDTLETEFATFLSGQDVKKLGIIAGQIGQNIGRQEKKIAKLREEYNEAGTGVFGQMDRSGINTRIEEAIAKLRELQEVQKVVIGAQPIVAAKALDEGAVEAEKKANDEKTRRAKDEATRKAEDARIFAERRRNLESVRQSLLSEEDLVRQSYAKRRELVINNTEENSADRRALLDELETQMEEELSLVEEAELAKVESIRNSLLTEEEAIQASYEARRQTILESTLLTETERQALLAKIDKKNSEDRRKFDLEQWKTSLSAFDDFQQNLQVLAKTGNKELSTVYKAAAIANTTIKTYESATSAYAALASIPFVGPALGAAAAAAAIAAGMANVNAIASTNAGSFAGGGYIPEGQVGLVGEAGPEMVRGPATVTSAADTRNKMGGESKPVVINFIGIDSSEIDSVDEREDSENRIIDIAVKRSISQSRETFASEISTGKGPLERALNRRQRRTG